MSKTITSKMDSFRENLEIKKVNMLQSFQEGKTEQPELFDSNISPTMDSVRENLETKNVNMLPSFPEDCRDPPQSAPSAYQQGVRSGRDSLQTHLCSGLRLCGTAGPAEEHRERLGQILLYVASLRRAHDAAPPFLRGASGEGHVSPYFQGTPDCPVLCSRSDFCRLA
eukprot:CAMPEP_0194294918 /NCGR_PEP_ID=MMETSP0169-20130528/52093_1 /TAXON_ID=218684 /ORGANISM="Corethron pennatum, Strain L29A3" /LENGTH=167 /DNA_ID=CAMNT_0039043937 /DNA_START=124 /DNA_END=624 /DNA_ORIENTATION=-